VPLPLGVPLLLPHLLLLHRRRRPWQGPPAPRPRLPSCRHHRRHKRPAPTAASAQSVLSALSARTGMTAASAAARAGGASVVGGTGGSSGAAEPVRVCACDAHLHVLYKGGFKLGTGQGGACIGGVGVGWGCLEQPAA
jgi:hypothetical protein